MKGAADKGGYRLPALLKAIAAVLMGVAAILTALSHLKW